jgi:DNA-binding XRE family transcriptional regulator
LTSNGIKLQEIRLKKLTISKAELAREAGIDVKTYGTIEEGIKPGRDITRESIANAVNRLLARKHLKPISAKELFSHR